MKGQPFAPIFCIDNLDIAERVHTHSAGNRNRMFRGTWGYIQCLDKSLLDPCAVFRGKTSEFGDTI